MTELLTPKTHLHAKEHLIGSIIFNPLSTTSRETSSKYDDLLEERWEAILEKSRSNSVPLWNSTLYRFEGLKIAENKLVLDVSYIEFKDLIVWYRYESNETAAGRVPLPLSVGAVIIDKDGKFIFGRRNSSQVYSQNELCLVAGLLSHTEQTVRDGNDLEQVLHRELQEELNVSGEMIADTDIQGIYQTSKGGVLILYKCLLNVSHEAVFRFHSKSNDGELVGVEALSAEELKNTYSALDKNIQLALSMSTGLF